MTAARFDARAIGESATTLIGVRTTIVEQLRARMHNGENYSDVLTRLLWPSHSARRAGGARATLPSASSAFEPPRAPSPVAAQPAAGALPRRGPFSVNRPCGSPDPRGGDRRCRLPEGHSRKHKTWGRNGSRSWKRN